jgi:hypothetical protein
MMLFSVDNMENRFGEKLRPVKGSVVMVMWVYREVGLFLKSFRGTAGRSGFVCGIIRHVG